MRDSILNQLAVLQQRDAETRKRVLHQNQLYGRYDEEMQRVHRENAAALAGIVAQYGWPGIALVGPDGCHLAWMIAQHSICTPELQKGFLLALAEAA